ncbi:MAG: Phosphodiester glycosidase, partial [Actinomycetota bacterium]
LGVVGITTHPQTTGGYAAKGWVKSATASMTTHAVNFSSLPASAAVVYDSNFTGITPKGDATLVVTSGVVTSMFTSGKAIAVPADGYVVQATGKHADNVRLFTVHPSASLPTVDLATNGYSTTTSTITIGAEKIAVNAVNLSNQTGNAFFNSSWKVNAPARAMTFVISSGKVSAVYTAGKAVKPTTTASVLQVNSPSAAVKKLKIGAKVTLAIKSADFGKGFYLGGSVTSNGVSIPVTAVNKSVSSPSGALLFDSNWTTTTVPGAVTLVVKSGVVTKFFTSGSAIKPATGEMVIQVPAGIAVTARQMSATTAVQVNPGESNKIERSIQTGSIKMNGSFVSGAVSIPILAVNFHVIAPGSATAFTHDFLGENWDHVTPMGAATVIVKNNLIKAIYPSGSWYAVTDPAEYVLQFSSGFASQISQLSVGATAHVNLTYETKGNADLQFSMALGRGATNLHSGVNAVTCNDNPPYVRPRTAIGWNTTGKFWIMTTSPQVDTITGTNGYRTGGSTVHQVGDWLKQLGATEAVSFDGGGSTFMLRSSSTGTHRVDMSDPNGFGQPWIRSAPIMLLLTSYVAPQ